MVTMETKPAMSDCTESRLQGAVGWEGGKGGWEGGGSSHLMGPFIRLTRRTPSAALKLRRVVSSSRLGNGTAEASSEQVKYYPSRGQCMPGVWADR